MEKVRWGIIGCGDVTEVKSGPALQKIPHSELVAVMRRDPAQARDYARRHRVPRVHDQALDLIRDPRVNAVYVATPPDSHCRFACLALRHQKPVYVEKPMALNYRQCRRMIRQARKARTPLFVAYYRRALPSFRKVKEIVDGGRMGPIRLVNLRLCRAVDPESLRDPKSRPWRFRPAVSGGGLLIDLGSHQLDYLHYLFGPVKKIAALPVRQVLPAEVEDVTGATLLFECGVVAHCLWCFSLPPGHNRDQIEILGERGRIRFSTFEFSPVEVTIGDEQVRYPFPKPPHVQRALLKTVVAQLRGEGRCPSTMESGAYTTFLLDRIRRPVIFI